MRVGSQFTRSGRKTFLAEEATKGSGKEVLEMVSGGGDGMWVWTALVVTRTKLYCLGRAWL